MKKGLLNVTTAALINVCMVIVLGKEGFIMIKKTIRYAFIGFFIGMPVGIVILLLMSFSNGGGELVFSELMLTKGGSEAGALALQVFLSGLFGAICWAGITFHEIESWGMLKAFIFHYAVIIAGFVVIGLNLGWIEFDAEQIGLMALFLGLGYCVVWVIMYLKYRAEAKELNKYLEEDDYLKAA